MQFLLAPLLMLMSVTSGFISDSSLWLRRPVVLGVSLTAIMTKSDLLSRSSRRSQYDAPTDFSSSRLLRRRGVLFLMKTHWLNWLKYKEKKKGLEGLKTYLFNTNI